MNLFLSLVGVVSSTTSSTQEYFTGTELLTWSQSLTFCESFGSSLASVHSLEDYYALLDACFSINAQQDTTISCWTGLNDRTNESVWQWSDGTSLQFGFDEDEQPIPDTIPWVDGEPNNWSKSGEQCVEVGTRFVGWNDLSCASEAYALCNAPDQDPVASASPYLLTAERMNWTRALAYCEQLGTSLASIHSMDDSLAAADACSQLSSAHCWIGLHKAQATDSEWQWSDGTGIGFGFSDGTPFESMYQWRLGEPNGADDLCVEYNVHSFNDARCWLQQYPVCNALHVTSGFPTAAPITTTTILPGLSNEPTLEPTLEPTNVPAIEWTIKPSSPPVTSAITTLADQDQGSSHEIVSPVTTTTTIATTENTQKESAAASFSPLIIAIICVLSLAGCFMLCGIFLLLHLYRKQISRVNSNTGVSDPDEEDEEKIPLSDLRIHVDNDGILPPSPGRCQALSEHVINNQRVQTMGRQGEISTTSIIAPMEGNQTPPPHDDIVVPKNRMSVSSNFYEDMYDHGSVDKHGATTDETHE